MVLTGREALLPGGRRTRRGAPGGGSRWLSEAPPEAFDHVAFDHYLLQPMDGPDLPANMASAVAFCLANPRWRLSLQIHKHLRIR